MDSLTPLPHASEPASTTPSRLSLIHHFLQRRSLQLAVVIVGTITTIVTGYGILSGQGIFFLPTQAQSLAKSLALRAGEQGIVTCDGKLGGSWVDPLTRRQLKITCSGGTVNPTSTARPTATPAIHATSTPTSAPTTSPTGGGMGSMGSNATVAASYGIWDPADPKYIPSGPQKYPTCPKTLHDSYFVIGPDGKKYPTWHPPVVVNPATGSKCTFGHEHGVNPSTSMIWNEVQEHFYFDANKNGIMDPEEKKTAGVPFGYANEQLDVYSQTKGTMVMRHEDHVGHKVEIANGEADMDGGSFGSSATGGVVVPIQKSSNGFKWTDSGAKCYYFSKVHQGVSTPDAFTNNLHEVIFFADCKGPTSAYDQKAAITEMVAFGAPGEFSNLCDAEGDRTTPVVIGKDANNQAWPGTRGQGFRNIISRSCIDKYFLVPQGKFSMNMYEAWATSMGITTAAGKTVLSGVNLTFDVEEANRYYDPSQPNKLGYSMDLCYTTLPNGNKARGGICDGATNYGKVQGITWNDTRSAFKGIHRGMYFQGPTLNNQGGSEVLYTDPFGKNGQTSPFPGSIKQTLSAKNVSYLNLGLIDPRQNDRIHDDGEGTVHAPN